MKKILAAAPILVAAFVVGSVSSAHADTTAGWYSSLGAGVTFTPDSTTKTHSGDADAEFSTGYNLSLASGYSWANGLRAEAQLFRSSADVDKVVRAGSANSGDLTNTDFFLNGLYDYNMNSMFTPYVGAGIGFAVADATNIGTLANGGAFSDNDVKLAYQAIVGVSAQLDRAWAMTADYRYVASVDPKFKTTVASTGSMENASHNLMLGLRYSYDTPTPMIARAMPPAVRKAGAPKPVVANIAQSYEVFFDFDKTVLTPEAQNILATAANDFKSGKYIKIAVTGHTDTVGSVAYNKGLSERRAAAVKAEMAKMGVPASAVVTRGVGKNDLLIPTADGVREAQNRRAEIVFQDK